MRRTSPFSVIRDGRKHTKPETRRKRKCLSHAETEFTRRSKLKPPFGPWHCATAICGLPSPEWEWAKARADRADSSRMTDPSTAIRLTIPVRPTRLPAETAQTDPMATGPKTKERRLKTRPRHSSQGTESSSNPLIGGKLGFPPIRRLNLVRSQPPIRGPVDNPLRSVATIRSV